LTNNTKLILVEFISETSGGSSGTLTQKNGVVEYTMTSTMTITKTVRMRGVMQVPGGKNINGSLVLSNPNDPNSPRVFVPEMANLQEGKTIDSPLKTMLMNITTILIFTQFSSL